MIVLVTSAMPKLERIAERVPAGYVGRLLTPRSCKGLGRLVESGLPYALDNDAFGAWDAKAYRWALERVRGLERGPLFVTAPDVVGDAAATDRLWSEWREEIGELPAGYVLQDGWTSTPADAEAVFLGGTTLWKLSELGRIAVADAKARGLWIHVGRVNTATRIRYAGAIGADSMDGSKWSRFTDAWIHQLDALPHRQGRLDLEEVGE